MNFLNRMFEGYCSAFLHYFSLQGRATRTQYWGFNFCLFLYLFIIWGAMAALLCLKVGFLAKLLSWLGLIFLLVHLIPSITISVRRLHDTGKSGWILFAYAVLETIANALGKASDGWAFNLASFVFSIVLVVFFCQKSDGPNKYGEPRN